MYICTKIGPGIFCPSPALFRTESEITNESEQIRTNPELLTTFHHHILCVCVKIWIHTYTTYRNIKRYVPVQYPSPPAFLWRIFLHHHRPVQPWLKSEIIMLSALQPIKQSGAFRPSMTLTFTYLLEHYERPNTNTNSRWWDMLIILNSCEICVLTSVYQSETLNLPN